MSNHPEELKRRKLLSNTIYWITLILLVLFLGSELILDFKHAIEFTTFDDWVPILLLLVSIASLLLNKYNYGRISRTIFLLSWITAVTVLPILLSKVSASSYLVHPILCILTSLMIHLFFSWYEDRWIYIYFLFTSFFLTTFSYYLLFNFDVSESFRELPLNKIQFVVIYSMSWVFINLTLIYVYRINWNAYIELRQKNQIIEHLNKSLETKVERRTRLLKEQNSKLMEYAFINAHVLRAPVSRILGLINLLRKPNSDTDEKEIIRLLEESSLELDKVVRNLSSTLQEAREDENALE
jgi:signal transduction histidine kinase